MDCAFNMLERLHEQIHKIDLNMNVSKTQVMINFQAGPCPTAMRVYLSHKHKKHRWRPSDCRQEKRIKLAWAAFGKLHCKFKLTFQNVEAKNLFSKSLHIEQKLLH